MSNTTKDLIEGLNQMLKNRGSMTVDEVQLLRDVICHLERHEELPDCDRRRNKELIVVMLLRLLLDPMISSHLAHILSKIVEMLR